MWRVWIASLAVAIIVGAPLLEIFHRASVQHAVCEHGDLIEPVHAGGHAGETAGIAFDASGPDGESSNRGRELRQESASAPHDHIHCQIGTLARAGIGTLSPTSPFARSLQSAATAVQGTGCVFHRRLVLANAPKTSPPSFSAIVLA